MRPGQLNHEHDHDSLPRSVAKEISDDPLLTATQVATWLRVHPKTVYTLGIPRIVLGRRSVRWRWSDVKAFAERRRTENELESAR